MHGRTRVFARRTQAMLIAIGLSIVCTLSSAQSTTDGTFDTQPPLIEFEAVNESPADITQVFTALVVDNVMLQDVTLYHRRAGQRHFTATTMTVIGATGYYSASITIDPADLRAIEYYLQARDTVGHRTVNGYAFEPHVRHLFPDPDAPPAAVSTTGVGDTISRPTERAAVATHEQFVPADSRRRWLMVGLGVLAVGALASLSDGGNSSQDDGTVPFSIDIGQP